MSEQRKYRNWTAKQKIEIVLAGLRSDRSVREVCREHAISETLYYGWRDQLLEAGGSGWPARRSGRASGSCAARSPSWTGDREKTVAGVELSVRAARSRELVAEGYPLSAVARAARISRQALYRMPRPRRPPQRRPPVDAVEQGIVAEALANQTDGYRMVCAFVRRKLGVAVNRKRGLRVMQERKLIQRRRPIERRRRPGFFRVERPRQLWQLDMTSVWVAEHGWCYLNAIIDCCTREIVGWQLSLRCRADEAIALVERAAAVHGIEPDELTLGSDNGSAFTARRFRAKLAELGIRHRRGGYRDPESQAFIESWFGKLKEREVWLNEYETLDDARTGIGGYVDRYHHRPHSSLNYRTPLEVRQTWEDLPELQKHAA